MSEKNVPQLGKPIEGQGYRDAIHVAIAPVKAIKDLLPGTHVGYRDGIVDPDFLPHVGIVDPFFDRMILADETFYLCLYANTVTSLRHVWQHPAFKAKLPRA